MIKEKSIHVMHVLGNLGMGGAEMGVVRLIESGETKKIRHSIAILGTDQSLLDGSRKEIPCHALGIESPSYTAFWQLARLFRRERVDLVHVNNLAPWFDAAIGAKLAGCRCIETFHGVEQGALRFSLPKQFMLRSAGQLSHRITAVAEEAAELFCRLTGIRSEDVEIIPNGIDTDYFLPAESPDAKRTLRRSKGLPEDALLFGCVAALRPVKNHALLLRSFAAALGEVSVSARLVLVGDGALLDDLKQLAQDLDVADQVHFLGRRNDVKELLQCFDAFALSSDTEGLSYSVLEAMACGLPFVGTAVGANIQLVQQGQNGFLTPVGDERALSCALQRLLTDRANLEELGGTARQRVIKDYDLTTMLARYERLYFDAMPS